jgi:hypothetical protein
MIMSKRWDYVYLLKQQTGLLFIPQVTYEQGEQQWNDIERE